MDQEKVSIPAPLPAPPSLSSLARDNDMIVVEVGPEHQQYRVYTALLSYYSEYFQKIVRGRWKEAEDRVIQLTDIEPAVFDIFIDWLYSQQLPKKNEQWLPKADDADLNSWQYDRLVDLLQMKIYVFADRFLVPRLRNAIHNYIADALIKNKYPPFYEAVIYAFDNLSSKNPMLKLLVNLHCAYWQSSCDRKNEGELKLRSELPFEFLVRVMIRYSKMKDMNKIARLTGRLCHEHASEEERTDCKRCSEDTESYSDDEEPAFEEEEEEIVSTEEIQVDEEPQTEPNARTEEIWPFAELRVTSPS